MTNSAAGRFPLNTEGQVPSRGLHPPTYAEKKFRKIACIRERSLFDLYISWISFGYLPGSFVQYMYISESNNMVPHRTKIIDFDGTSFKDNYMYLSALNYCMVRPIVVFLPFSIQILINN